MPTTLFHAELNDFKMVHNVLKSVLFKEVNWVMSNLLSLVHYNFVVCNFSANRRRTTTNSRRNEMCRNDSLCTKQHVRYIFCRC